MFNLIIDTVLLSNDGDFVGDCLIVCRGYRVLFQVKEPRISAKMNIISVILKIADHGL